MTTDSGGELIEVYVNIFSLLVYLRVFIACGPINQNPSLMANGDRLSTKET